MWLPRIQFALFEFALLALVFFAVAVCVHGLRQLRPSDQWVRDSRLNLTWLLVEVMAVAPLLAGVPLWIESGLESVGVAGLLAAPLGALPLWLQIVLACVVVDGIGYWRHRWMHTRPLWPVHSVHHSDLTVSWLTLARFHPLNRLVSVVLLSLAVALLGFPRTAVAAGVLVVHYYGFFVHADVPWRFGPLRTVFVSPVLHRWHHSYADDARDKNFATLFAFWDVAFGTFALPERSPDHLGTGDPAYPQRLWGQLLHPFRVWLGPAEAKPLAKEPLRTS